MPNGSQYQTVSTGYAGPWVDQVLQALGAPTTDSNRAALRAWAASEGTLNSNNPLAFSGQYPGATTCLSQCNSGSPVYAYSSSQQGAANTASFILGNSSYANIVQAFRSDAGLSSIWSAINGSPWCAGCQSGTYPTALHTAAGGGITGGGSPGAGGGTSSSGADQASAAAPCAGSNPAPVWSVPVVGTIINECQALKIKGWALMVTGGLVGFVGLAVVLTAFGLESKAGQIVNAIPGGRALNQARRTTTRTATQAAPETAGRRESREIERRYQETERQQGPIGPRGGSETSRRVAERERSGRSVPGPGRGFETRRQARQERAAQPF